MKTTGFKLSAAIQKHEMAKDAALQRFDDSLRVFSGEDKPPPGKMMEEVMKHEVTIAKLQAAQAFYNSQTQVTVGTETIALSLAIKLLGAYVREAKRWKDVISPDKRRGGYLYETNPREVRNKEHEYAKPGISKEEAAQKAGQALSTVQALRAAIALGNATPLTIPGEEGLLD